MNDMEIIGWIIILVCSLAALGICVNELCSDSPSSLYIDEEEIEYQKWKKKRDRIEQERKFEQRYRKEQKGD